MAKRHEAGLVVPRFGEFYRCRFHGNGEQVCLFLGHHRSGGYLVLKWITASRRWTKKILIEKSDLLGVASRKFCQKRDASLFGLVSWK
jgi:hypothetical protein